MVANNCRYIFSYPKNKGKLVDKITILEIKKEKVSDQKSLEIIDKEYSSLRDSMIAIEE